MSPSIPEKRINLQQEFQQVSRQLTLLNNRAIEIQGAVKILDELEAEENSGADQDSES